MSLTSHYITLTLIHVADAHLLIGCLECETPGWHIVSTAPSMFEPKQAITDCSSAFIHPHWELQVDIPPTYIVQGVIIQVITGAEMNNMFA